MKFAVGAIFIHVYVAGIAADSFHKISLTFTCMVVVVGSFCIHNENVLVAVRQLRVTHQSVLKLYGRVCGHIHVSSVLVTIKLHAVASSDDQLLNVNVGTVES